MERVTTPATTTAPAEPAAAPPRTVGPTLLADVLAVTTTVLA